MMDYIVVQTILNGRHGSGVLFQPKKEQYSYIITARHCIFAKNNLNKLIDLSLLVIKRQIDGIMKELLVDVLDIIDNIEYDIAVIKINHIDNIPAYNVDKSCNNVDIHIVGFPNGLAGTKSIFKRYSLDGKVNDFPKKHILQINAFRRLDTNSQEAYDTMASFSGSGIFINRNGQFYQIGILTEMSSCDGAFDSLIGTSLEIVHQLLIDKSWEGLGMEDDNVSNTTAIDINKKCDVLFNNYTIKSEPYYIKRDIDNEFIPSLELSNIWVHGRSGTGKTAFINRNLLINDMDFCYCDFSPIEINSTDDVINEILFALEDKLHFESDKNETNKIKQINSIISKMGIISMAIVIDELAVDNEELLCNIADNLTRIITYCHNTNSNCNIRFIIATINNPHNLVKNKLKTLEYFQILCCNTWDDYMETLFDCISAELQLDINNYKRLILDNVSNSPRLLKAICRKIIITKSNNESSITNIIQRIQREVI